jgi:hypothetical protein
MSLIKMEVLTKPLNMWNKTSIRPGPVGSVGDAIVSVKFKHSSPDLPQRWDPEFHGKVSELGGSNVSDGMWHGYVSGGRGAATIEAPLGYRQGFKTAVGWVHEDIRRPDTSRQPIMGSTGQWGWKNKVATVYQAKRTGEMFLPEPMGYDSSQTNNPRGSQIPRIVAQSEGLGKALPAADIPITDPVFGEQGTIPNPSEHYIYVDDKDPAYENAIWVPQNGQDNRDAYIDTVGYYVVSRYNKQRHLPQSSERPQKVYTVGSKRYEVTALFNEKGWINRKVPFPKKLARGPGDGRIPVPPEKKPTTTVPAPQPGTQIGLSCRPNVQGLTR